MAYDPNNPYAPDDQRTPYTGTFGEKRETPEPTAFGVGQSLSGASRAPGPSQLGGYPTGANGQPVAGGYIGQAPAYAGDAPGSNPNAQVNQNAQAWASTGGPTQAYSDFGEYSATLGGGPNSAIGDPARAANAALQLQAYGASQRQGPQINLGATNMFAGGTGQALQHADSTNLLGINSLNDANRTNLYGMRQGLDLAGTANGQAVQGQMGLAGQLQALGRMPAGPSVAEQQLRMGADQSLQQQLAMAAGARGGNAGLALQSAGANQGQVMGNLNGQLALQRASEDMANRQFAANALNSAGGMYGQALQGQQNAYGGAAGIFGNVAGNQVAQAGQLGNIANNQLGQANTGLGLTNTYAGLAGDQAKLQSTQNALNDQTMIASQGMGYDLLSGQRQAEMNQYANQMQFGNQRYGIDKNYNQALELQKRQNDNDFGHQLLAAGLTAAGTVGGFFLGGPAGAAAGGIGANRLASSINDSSNNNTDEVSDIRAKTRIAPAGDKVADAFRPLSSSSYLYRDPNAPGAHTGTQYGPMAQQLEQTPAGATAVTTMPNGQKGIDTGRLALMNASATADMRRELDAIKAGRSFAPESGVMDQHTMYRDDPNGARRPVQAGTGRDGNMVALAGYSPQFRGIGADDTQYWSKGGGQSIALPPRAPMTPSPVVQGRAARIDTLGSENADDAATLEAIRRAQEAATAALSQPTAYPTPRPYGGY